MASMPGSHPATTHAPSPVAVRRGHSHGGFDYLIGHGSEVAQCWRQHRGHGLIPIFISGSQPQGRQPNELAERQKEQKERRGEREGKAHQQACNRGDTLSIVLTAGETALNSV